MELLDRIYALHRELDNAHRPIPVKTLSQRLECSESTVKRTANRMRDYYNAPIESSRQGYYYQQHGDTRFELPGLWFTPAEVRALLTLQQLLADIQPGLLTPLLAPLKKRIGGILDLEQDPKPAKPPKKAKPSAADRQLSLIPEPAPEPPSPHLQAGARRRAATAEMARRTQLYTQAARQQAPAMLTRVADALGRRRRLHIHYHGRERNSETERNISPQRLTHYRDNWYLEAWCHRADGLRRFSLDRILDAQLLDQAAIDIDLEQLTADMGSAYGIFSGPGEHTAELLFTPERARWVADERWHPKQQGRFHADGHYQLDIPYTDPRELILDILRYGPDVEVLAPDDLREQVHERLRAALKQYNSNP